MLGVSMYLASHATYLYIMSNEDLLYFSMHQRIGSNAMY